MDSVKPIRLNKAAREFNISMQTVVEFLAKKGYDIDSNPNTKLGPELVMLLEQEFHNDKVLKQEITEKNKEAKKKLESLTIEEVEEALEEDVVSDEVDAVAQEEEPEPKVEAVEEEEIVEPKEEEKVEEAPQETEVEEEPEKEPVPEKAEEEVTEEIKPEVEDK